MRKKALVVICRITMYNLERVYIMWDIRALGGEIFIALIR